MFKTSTITNHFFCWVPSDTSGNKFRETTDRVLKAPEHKIGFVIQFHRGFVYVRREITTIMW